ncbi:MAG: hypothetical protein LIP05_03095 [Tannerellaceae bacterium]|nr:hypothetical protein [Tannerellaceae bacterium]
MQKYIYTILAVISITACTKEVIIEIPVTVEPAKTNVTFGVRTSQFTTKDSQDHYTTEPTLEERRIFNYAILIFQPATGSRPGSLAVRSR